MMISAALELYVGVGRVGHNWCMCVAGHGYGGLDMDWDEGVGWYSCGLVACREMPGHLSAAQLNSSRISMFCPLARHIICIDSVDSAVK